MHHMRRVILILAHGSRSHCLVKVMIEDQLHPVTHRNYEHFMPMRFLVKRQHQCHTNARLRSQHAQYANQCHQAADWEGWIHQEQRPDRDGAVLFCQLRSPDRVSGPWFGVARARLVTLCLDPRLRDHRMCPLALDKLICRTTNGQQLLSLMCQRLREARILRSAVAALALAGIVLALLMSVSPDLHKSLHHDSDQAQHECLATMLDNGGCEGAPVVLFVARLQPESQLVLLTCDAVAAGSYFLSCSIFEHAPPVLS